MSTPTPTVGAAVRSAVISQCDLFRYRFDRVVAPEGKIFAYFGVNGSTADGTLCVMQKDADGYRRMVEDGMDPAAVLETIKIECDGDDW